MAPVDVGHDVVVKLVSYRVTRVLLPLRMPWWAVVLASMLLEVELEAINEEEEEEEAAEDDDEEDVGAAVSLVRLPVTLYAAAHSARD